MLRKFNTSNGLMGAYPELCKVVKAMIEETENWDEEEDWNEEAEEEEEDDW